MRAPLKLPGPRLDRLRMRFDAEMENLRSGERKDLRSVISHGRIRYLRTLVRRVCDETGEPVPDWAE